MTLKRGRGLLAPIVLYSTALLFGWVTGYFADMGFQSRQLSIGLCGPRLLVAVNKEPIDSPEGLFIERRQSPYAFPGALLVRRSPLTGQWIVWLPFWAIWMSAVLVHGTLLLVLRGRRRDMLGASAPWEDDGPGTTSRS